MKFAYKLNEGIIVIQVFKIQLLIDRANNKPLRCILNT